MRRCTREVWWQEKPLHPAVPVRLGSVGGQQGISWRTAHSRRKKGKAQASVSVRGWGEAGQLCFTDFIHTQPSARYLRGRARAQATGLQTGTRGTPRTAGFHGFPRDTEALICSSKAARRPASPFTLSVPLPGEMSSQ